MVREEDLSIVWQYPEITFSRGTDSEVYFIQQITVKPGQRQTVDYPMIIFLQTYCGRVYGDEEDDAH